MKTVFVNPERCVGCRQCEYACASEHAMKHDSVPASWETPAPTTRIHVEAGPRLNSSFPNRCRHCDPAPCTIACPTGAMRRDEMLGLVLVADGKCIACAMCAMVCPFDAVTFHPNGSARVVATKCDGCAARVTRGEEPACVETCKAGALVWGELNELIAQGRARASVALLTTLAASEAIVDAARPGDDRGVAELGRRGHGGGRGSRR